jgi:hypothetical protein
VLVTRTVKDLVVGAEIPLVDRGPHRLKGVPTNGSCSPLEVDDGHRSPRNGIASPRVRSSRVPSFVRVPEHQLSRSEGLKNVWRSRTGATGGLARALEDQSGVGRARPRCYTSASSPIESRP